VKLNPRTSGDEIFSGRRAVVFVLGAAASFHAAYLTPLVLLIFGYVACLVQLARLRTTRLAFYFGLLAGLLCFAPELEFFWRIFGVPSVTLWVILAVWIALFTAIMHVMFTRFGAFYITLLAPFLWTGLEYFRSEIYYLRFSWLNIGYALNGAPIPFNTLGVYGVGFFAVFLAALILVKRYKLMILTFVAVLGYTTILMFFQHSPPTSPLQVVGVQMEFPSDGEVVSNLGNLVKHFPDAQLLVLSEYTFTGPIPDKLKKWCRENGKYLIVGGEDAAPNNAYYDTAFVVGPSGEVIFKQAKSVLLQFFADGLPAMEQRVWNSPWGKIGICICYDLSYTRVTDKLIRLGAQALIVPTMDLEGWGRHEHELHRRIALTRAVEYGVPIFRVGSSGISQSVNCFGVEDATAPFPGDGATISAKLNIGHPGRLPLDRVLVPMSVAITGGMLAWLAGSKFLSICLGWASDGRG